MSGWTIERAADDDTATLEQVRELFAEYHAWLGQVVCSARLAEEIADLPGPYASPSGRLFIARGRVGAAGGAGEVALGCVGVRQHEGDRAEIKRLYVREAARGQGLGAALLVRAIDAARESGYRQALVTTLPEMMPVAASMYERLGFEVTEPFFDHSAVGEDAPMTYLCLDLTRSK